MIAEAISWGWSSSWKEKENGISLLWFPGHPAHILARCRAADWEQCLWSGSREPPGLLCPPSYLQLLLCHLLGHHRVRDVGISLLLQDAGISLLAVLEGG